MHFTTRAFSVISRQKHVAASHFGVGLSRIILGIGESEMNKSGNHSANDQLALMGVKAVMAQRIMGRRMARGVSDRARETALQATGWPTNPTYSRVCISDGIRGGDAQVCWDGGEDDCGMDM
jgi:hypothetical protein